MVRYNWKHHPSQPSVSFYVQQYNSNIEFLTQSIQQINCFVYSRFLYQPFGLLEQFGWGRHFSTLVPIIRTLYLRSGSKVIIQYACAKLEHPPTLSPTHLYLWCCSGRATSTMQWRDSTLRVTCESVQNMENSNATEIQLHGYVP